MIGAAKDAGWQEFATVGAPEKGRAQCLGQIAMDRQRDMNRPSFLVTRQMEHPVPTPQSESRSRIRPLVALLAVLAAALLMTWPALYNGYPLLYPDSMSYLEDGRRVARALLLREFSPYYGWRSFIYGMAILPFHWNVAIWPVVGVHAVLTAYVLWLVVRSLLPQRTLPAYFASVVMLSVLTGLPWFVGFIMPDILGPLLYLCVYLIVYWWDALTRSERTAIGLVAWWAAASHSTHLLLLGGLCVLVVPLLILQGYRSDHCVRALSRMLVIAFGAAAANIAVHAYLYGNPSLTGHRPPILMTRLIADGPARWYLQEHCGQMEVLICDHVQDLPDNVTDFLWAPNAIWRNAPLQQQDRLRREEMPVVLGTIRAYPWEVLSTAAAHSWRQLGTFGLWNYDPNPWILEVMDSVLPGARASYLESRQAHRALHEDFFTLVQDWTVKISAVVIAVCFLFLRRIWSRQLAGLATFIAFVVISNAVITGTLSNVEDRYQGRVVWLVPLLASMLVIGTAPGPGLFFWRTGKQRRGHGGK